MPSSIPSESSIISMASSEQGEGEQQETEQNSNLKKEVRELKNVVNVKDSELQEVKRQLDEVKNGQKKHLRTEKKTGIPMIGGEYLNHLWNGSTGKLKTLVGPLLKDGIGDRMDKGNLWVVPSFTMFAFAILWTVKLSKIALEQSTCRGASIYNFEGTQLDDDAKKHCQTGKRYFVGVNEEFSLDPQWRTQREVKNGEWILWFWGPVVFIMYVLPRFIWSLLMENQGINFDNVISASKSMTVDNDGLIEVDERRLAKGIPVISNNLRTAKSTRALCAFLVFEFSLVAGPLLLLFFILPLMIGANYRTWGFDIVHALCEGRDWQGSPLTPIFDFSGRRERPLVPLIPRITYCDYHFVSLGNTHTLTYRCYLDANWHERTALFTWAMLMFVTLINVGNLISWIEWAIRMRSRNQRRNWVTKKWLNADDFSQAKREKMRQFAEGFKMGQLLCLYYIECHTDRVLASAICTALFGKWLERPTMESTTAEARTGMENPENPIGSKFVNANPHVIPTAPFATPPCVHYTIATRSESPPSNFVTPKSTARHTAMLRCPNIVSKEGGEEDDEGARVEGGGFGN